MKFLNNTVIILILIFITFYLNNDFAIPSNDFISSKSDKFKNTVFASFLNDEIIQSKNLIYSSGFQLALNELLHNLNSSSREIFLNPITTSKLNENKAWFSSHTPSFFSIVGKSTNQLINEINSRISNFTLINSISKIDSLISLSYFEPKLIFDNPFEHVYLGLNFIDNNIIYFDNDGNIIDKKIQYFGTDYGNINEKCFKNQIKLLYEFRPSYTRDLPKIIEYYKIPVKFPEGFILQLNTKNTIEIIISTIPPQKKLIDESTLKRSKILKTG
jgi:hypothetical protein